MRVPGFLSTPQRKPEEGETWQTVPFGSQGQRQHDGATWNVYVSDTWWTWGDKNWQIRWRATYLIPRFFAPPVVGAQDAVWDVRNTVVTSADEVIRYDPDDPELSHPVVSWNIEHKAWPEPTQFDVTVRIRDLAGNVIKTITTVAGPGQGSQEWDGSLDSGGQASKGVYTYTVTAVHRLGNGPCPYCTDTDKVEVPQIGITGITHSLDVPSLTLTLMVAWQVAGAVDNCRIAIFSPKGLAKKATHALGDNGHFDGAASGTEIFDLQLDPDEFGTFWAVIYAGQTPQAGLANRSLQPRLILHHGASVTEWPKAINAAGAGDGQEYLEGGVSDAAAKQLAGDGKSRYAAARYSPATAGVVYEQLDECAIVFCLSHSMPNGVTFSGVVGANTLYGEPYHGNEQNDEENGIYWIFSLPSGAMERCRFAFFWAPTPHVRHCFRTQTCLGPP